MAKCIFLHLQCYNKIADILTVFNVVVVVVVVVGIVVVVVVVVDVVVGPKGETSGLVARYQLVSSFSEKPL